MGRQAGLFDIEERLRELSAKGDNLERTECRVKGRLSARVLPGADAGRPGPGRELDLELPRGADPGGARRRAGDRGAVRALPRGLGAQAGETAAEGPGCPLDGEAGQGEGRPDEAPPLAIAIPVYGCKMSTPVQNSLESPK